jgi:hypothetical protein
MQGYLTLTIADSACGCWTCCVCGYLHAVVCSSRGSRLRVPCLAAVMAGVWKLTQSARLPGIGPVHTARAASQGMLHAWCTSTNHSVRLL